MAKRPAKSTVKPKNPKVETESEHFTDVARKLFKVPKTEIDARKKDPGIDRFDCPQDAMRIEKD